MTATSRVLTCTYNRRRTRIHPHHDESTMQTSKPKIAALKPRSEPPLKLSMVSENSSEWPSLDKDVRTPSLEMESESTTEQSIFRRRVDLEDDDDMFVLKRANPVYDSDDEDYMASPAKRQRTTENTVITWEDRLSDDETDGYTLSLSLLHAH